jgi:hypothetical protein
LKTLDNNNYSQMNLRDESSWAPSWLIVLMVLLLLVAIGCTVFFIIMIYNQQNLKKPPKKIKMARNDINSVLKNI